MDLLIAAGVPSAITAFCFWLIERKIQVRAEAEKEERLNRQREQDAKWLQVIMSEEVLLKIIDWWFKEVKDLLDDGKVNGSQN